MSWFRKLLYDLTPYFVTRLVASWFDKVLVLETDLETNRATRLFWYNRSKLVFADAPGQTDTS